MDTYLRFLYEFLMQFFNGVGMIFTGLLGGVKQMFDVTSYIKVINFYKEDFNGPEWAFVAIAIFLVVLLLALIILVIYFLIRKYIRFRKTLVEQEELLEEVATLNDEVSTLVKEKEDILAMKVSHLGLKPGETDTEEGEDNTGKDATPDGEGIRFPKLYSIDEAFANYKVQNYNNNFTLPELVDNFRNFAASQLRLYYKPEMIRLFISALASTKLVILQGISGTGKTSLAYAWGKFLKNDSTIASVQPSWRDRTELFGYFNEFTKKFNETDVLKKMYEAGYNDIVYITVLDEMNIARVEYYFAEMLSILEMPSRDEWLIEMVSSSWDNDPKKLEDGKLRIPGNMWYVGTINNDDSTFMVTDKVYDRAMPINIDEKADPFDAPETKSLDITYTHMRDLFLRAQADHKVSQEVLDKLALVDKYIIEHFRIAFGNRIVKQLTEFVPAYVACGATEVEGIDYVIANKILRKFDQLNLGLVRNEIDGFIAYLDELFGPGEMKECIAYLNRLKKMI